MPKSTTCKLRPQTVQTDLWLKLYQIADRYCELKPWHILTETPVTREERAERAKVIIREQFNNNQQVFLDFVLSHYVCVGVEELDQANLADLLRLKYHNSLSNAEIELRMPASATGQFRDSRVDMR